MTGGDEKGQGERGLYDRGVSGLVGRAQGKKGVAKRNEIDSRLEGWRVEQQDKIERGGMV